MDFRGVRLAPHTSTDLSYRDIHIMIVLTLIAMYYSNGSVQIFMQIIKIKTIIKHFLNISLMLMTMILQRTIKELQYTYYLYTVIP